jgi:hypothetical protein
VKKSRQVIAGLLIFLIVILGGFQCKSSLQRFEETRSLMDTYVKVVIYSDESVSQEATNA